MYETSSFSSWQLKMRLIFPVLPNTALSEGLSFSQEFLNIAVTSVFPSQSANKTSWKTNGEMLDPSVNRIKMCFAAAMCGPLIWRNSSRELPSFSWLDTLKQKKIVTIMNEKSTLCLSDNRTIIYLNSILLAWFIVLLMAIQGLITCNRIVILFIK